MEISKVSLVFFSPTGTTKRVIQEIAGVLPCGTTQEIDLTTPANLESLANGLTIVADLAVIGMPVYSGRVPKAAAQRLAKVHGSQTPAVLVCVYGNRHYDDCILELSDLSTGLGFVPVAAAAFIGEHSFSCLTAPIAAGRPDNEDLAIAREFGCRVSAKLASARGIEHLPQLRVPGRRPYRRLPGLPKATSSADPKVCTGCRACVQACPVAAIPEDGGTADRSLCLACNACVKACPVGARSLEGTLYRVAVHGLARLCRARRQPETFF